MEPQQSCSNSDQPREVEYGFDHAGGKGKEANHRRWDSVVSDRRLVTFNPILPKPTGVDLKGREVILAIATFFLVSVCIGMVVFLVSDITQSKVIYLGVHMRIFAYIGSLYENLQCLGKMLPG